MDTPRFCLCGCGTELVKNSKGRWPRYVNYHHNRGVKLTPEQIAARKATRLERNGGVYQTAKGWKHSPETIAKMTKAVRARDLTGENNPFFGKTHTREARERMGARGADSPHWKGGVGTFPYGPEFTRKFKRMIRQRDGQQCQRCGITRAEYGKTLEVHHIDHNKDNNDPLNLATVCRSCNTWCWWHQDQPLIPLNRR